MKKLITLVLALFPFVINAQFSYEVSFANFFNRSVIKSSTIDSIGNTYITGRFNYYSNFYDNTTNNAFVTKGGYDGFVTKYNDNGDIIWVNHFGGEFDDAGTDIIVDNIGDVYVLGTFMVSCTFNDETKFESGSSQVGDLRQVSQSFIMKLDGSNGNILWKSTFDNRISLYGPNYGVKLRLNSNNEIITVLMKTWPSTSGIHLITLSPSGEISKISNGSKYDSNFQSIRDMEIDKDNNIYITGSFYDRLDLDLTPGENIISAIGGMPAAFFVRYNSNHELVWGQSIDGNGVDEGYELAYDKLNDNLFLSGWITGTVNINPLGDTPYNITSNPIGGSVGFFASYNIDGKVNFGHSFIGNVFEPGSASVSSIQINNESSKVIIYGKFYEKPDLMVTSDKMIPPYSGGTYNDYYFSIYDLIDFRHIETYYLVVYSANTGEKPFVMLDQNSIIFSLGGASDFKLIDSNNNTIFSKVNPYQHISGQPFSYSGIVKIEGAFSPTTNNSKELHSNMEIAKIYPIPFSNQLNIDIHNVNSKLSITNLYGGKLFETNLAYGRNSINTNFLKSGVYIVVIESNSQTITKQVICINRN